VIAETLPFGWRLSVNRNAPGRQQSGNQAKIRQVRADHRREFVVEAVVREILLRDAVRSHPRDAAPRVLLIASVLWETLLWTLLLLLGAVAEFDF